MLSSHTGFDFGIVSEDNIPDRKSTRLNSSHLYISYAVFCLKKLTSIHLLVHHVPVRFNKPVCVTDWSALGVYYQFWLIEVFDFFFNDTATTEIYTLSLHDALPI